MLSLAVVIATHNRPELLANRALPSVASQSRAPEHLIVVDDSDEDVRRTNARIVSKFDVGGVATRYIENCRTRGVSGASNTAIAYLQANYPATFVAFLDDDDAWDPSYLRKCEKAALDRDLDMVAAGLIYRPSGDSDGVLLDPPAELDSAELLVRNTHIQGSNTFVRLSRILEAGGFDEAMESTTDRDVCIRLADLGTVRFGALREHLVDHYADSDRLRLSTPGSDKNGSGLRYFYRKYRGRMSADQRQAFIERCRRLFDCDPTIDDPPPPSVERRTVSE